MAYFKRNGTSGVGLNRNPFPADEDRSAAKTGRDRRKTTRLFKNWELYQQPNSMPDWRVRPRVSTGDLQDYCVCGCLTADKPGATVEELGAIYLECLNSSSAGSDGDPYAAAVLMGIFTQLGASLRTRPWPLFDEGKFPTPDFGAVFYRLVVLPFTRNSRSVDQWLALGSWRPEAPFRTPYHAV